MSLCGWWLYIQSIVSGNVFLVGPIPVCFRTTDEQKEQMEGKIVYIFPNILPPEVPVSVQICDWGIYQ